MHEGDPSIESFRGVFMKMRLALGTTAFVDAPTAPRQVLAGPDGLRFIVVGAQPKPAYDGRPSL